MSGDLRCINWRITLEGKTTNDAWKAFTGTVTKLAERHRQKPRQTKVDDKRDFDSIEEEEKVESSEGQLNNG
jgi:hypothetical protein